MAYIRALPWNGFRVASLFAGCGGSSLGYRMAGFRVVYANEFIPEARESYSRNAWPKTVLDGQDIRNVTPESILDKIGLEIGQLDLLDGSPPCAAFSTAGDREKTWNKPRKYSGTVQRTDDLFFEYARILRGLRPKVFVAENVSGLVKGVAKGYFLEILAELKACGYRVKAAVLDAQWYGVPQSRARLIFVGVRDDLAVEPCHPPPLAYRYSIRDVLPHIERLKGGNGMPHDGKGAPIALNRPSPSVLATASHMFAVEKETDISKYAVGAEWDRIGPGGQSERYFQLVRPALNKPCPTITAEGGEPSIASVTHPTEKRKFSIAELRLICGFPSDFVLTGSFGQQWERLGRAVPPPLMAAIATTIRDRILCPMSDVS